MQYYGGEGMSVETVRKYFQDNNLDLKVIEFKDSTATVELAAAELGVEPDRIAKTMALKTRSGSMILVTKGGARLDNRKFKDCFKEKGTMLSHDEVEEITGHPIGGVCPFALKKGLKVYLDVSLKEFDIVYPAGGSASSAVRITPEYLQQVTSGQWVDVCK
jgi:prolyl-tRNA editing enzyme YbaK/EbsC (Cys-tRNA(Pro) deacylase)